MTRRRRPVDFTAIRALVSPFEVLQRCGWHPVTSMGVEARGPCPFHGSSSNRSRTLQVNRTYLYCHKCKVYADSVGVWAKLKGVDPLTAAYEVCAEFGISPPFAS